MAYSQKQAHARVDVKRAHCHGPGEPTERGLGTECEVVHDDGTLGGYSEQCPVVGERQGEDGIRVGVHG